MKLYRSVIGTPYTGPGSFWSPDPAVAKKYGKRGSHLIWTTANGQPLEAEEDELIHILTLAGVHDAENRVIENDILENDVYEALRNLGYTWIARLVDPSISSNEMEWIYIGKQPVRWRPA